MRITPTVTQIARVFSYQANTQARAFGRKVEAAEAESKFKMLRPVLHLCKRISDWVISHTHNVSPALTTGKLTHPVDTLLQKNPVTLPRKISRQLHKKLMQPDRGLTFNEANVADIFTKDVFRQHVRLHVENGIGKPQKTFDSRQFYSQKIKSEPADAVLEQAQDALSGFAGNHPPLVRTLSAIANQASQSDPSLALMDMVNRKLGSQGDIMFTDNNFMNCDITCRRDRLYQVELNWDFQQAMLVTNDGNGHPLQGAAAHIKVRYLVDADGKVLEAKPKYHVKWPGFSSALAAGA